MPMDLEETKALLRRTPDVLEALLRGLPEGWAHRNEGPDTWSSVDVTRVGRGHGAHFGHRDHVDRFIVISPIGDHDRSGATLGAGG